jgi:hypothetical protein
LHHVTDNKIMAILRFTIFLWLPSVRGMSSSTPELCASILRFQAEYEIVPVDLPPCTCWFDETSLVWSQQYYYSKII